MDAELYQRLIGNAAVMDASGGQIYPLSAPKEAVAPLIVWQRISRTHDRALDERSWLAQVRVQIDSYGASYFEARALANAVQACLDDWNNPVGRIRDCTLDNDRALRETDPALKTFRVSQDYIVTFEEAGA